MKIPINNIPTRIMIRLLETIYETKQRGTYLPAFRQEIPTPNLWLIGAGLISVLIAFQANSYVGYEYYIIVGSWLLYSIVREFQKLFNWRRFGKDAVFFDPLYFISIKGKELQILPLSQYIESDIILSPDNKMHLARFHFRGITVLQPCASNVDNSTLQFQTVISQYCNSARDSFQNQEPIHLFSQTFADKLSSKRIPLIITLFALVVLWFLVPTIIDRNQYKVAKAKNTATAYRMYLSEPRNIRYRESARVDIRALYDIYINKYKANALSSTGANAFAQVVEYLRDKNLYTVKMIFYPESKLVDLPSSDGYQIIPV
ncbi:MAG: hypothetical protein PHP42_06980, partial [Bacteroidota bacterium]|nr:hypothetical protein [Bacteroidota bacterium]